jgi:hypothetical protein
VVQPLPKESKPRVRSRVQQTVITRTRTSLVIGDDARVAIVPPTIAIRVACQTIRTLSRQAYGLVVRRSVQFVCGKEMNRRCSCPGLGELMVRH